MNNTKKGVSIYSTPSSKSKVSEKLDFGNSEFEEAQIKKIGILSFATTYALISLFMGVLMSIFLVIYLLNNPLLSEITQGTSLGVIFGFGTIFIILIFLVLYGVMGFVSALITGALYNLAAKITKGIKLYTG